MPDTIEQDVSFNSGNSAVDATAEAFFKQFIEDAGQPSEETDVKKTPVQTAEVEDDESPPEPSEQEQDEPKRQYAEDDWYSRIKVEDEELEVPVKDLKRLYGQERALTKRSQEVAELRRKADEETTKAVTSLQVLLKRTQERAAPYKGIDFLDYARKYDAETVNNLRQAAVQAYEEENFLQNELNSFVQTIKENQEKYLEEMGQKCVEQLEDPASPYHLPEWSDSLYDELRDFAVASGIQQDVIDNLVEAPVIKLLYDAMQYRKGVNKVVVTKKVSKEPKKIMKGTSQPPPANQADLDKEKQALQKLRRSGSTDDAADLFLSRWSRNAPLE